MSKNSVQSTIKAMFEWKDSLWRLKKNQKRRYHQKTAKKFQK